MKTILKAVLGSGFLILLGGCCATNPFFCDVVAKPVVAIDFSQFSEDDGYGSGNKWLTGYQAGAAVSKPIAEQLSFETGLHMAAKGNKNSLADGEEYNYEQKTSMTYLDIPLLARYHFGESGFSAYGGAQPSLLLNAKSKTSGTGGSESEKITDNFKSLDVAASIGLGYQFKNGVHLNVGYDYGLTDINNTNNASKIQNRTFKFGVGYSFGKSK